MASPSGRTNTSLTDKLSEEAYRFEFFQAVRLLRLLATEQASGISPGESARYPVGEDYSPGDEIVRFHSHVSHSFPPSDIVSFTVPTVRDESGASKPPSMVISFMGLTGPQGVLPQHYTQLLIDRVRRKDYALRDYFDIFHHRMVSLFYRAWEKYRVAIGYERSRYGAAEETDLFLECLYSVVGLGTRHLRQRLEWNDEVFLHYGGHFAHAPRNAISLERMLEDCLRLPVHIAQFQGQWLYLRSEDQTRMPSVSEPEGRNNQLGVTAVVGERVWGIENRFRLRLGPLTYSQFLEFAPEGKQLIPLSQLTRSYVGPDFDFEIQPVLLAEETPWCQLTDENTFSARLGWNTWLRGDAMSRNPEDAIFTHSGNPV
jgi:type VI secretion system protein ImpH